MKDLTQASRDDNMEIKTTSQIESKLRELVLDAKSIKSINIREDFTKKKWVLIDDDFIDRLYGLMSQVSNYSNDEIQELVNELRK